MRTMFRICHTFNRIASTQIPVHAQLTTNAATRLCLHRMKHSSPCPTNTVHQQDNDLIFEQDEEMNNATITFNRPHAANAVGCNLLKQLQDTITYLNSDEAKNIRCVVLKSCSTRVFSAGADLRERSQMTKTEASAFVTSLRNTFNDLASLPMPVIACVEGAALGGGLEIVLTTDIVCAGKKASFGVPETSLAIIPGAGGTQRLPRLIGNARAKDMIFRAQRIDAETAYKYGLVHHLVESGEAEKKAREIAREISRNGPLALRAAKKSISRGEGLSISDALEVERACYETIIPTQDRLEGLAAFSEKREPVYTGS